jgi:hypothetical protein
MSEEAGLHPGYARNYALGVISLSSKCLAPPGFWLTVRSMLGHSHGHGLKIENIGGRKELLRMEVEEWVQRSRRLLSPSPSHARFSAHACLKQASPAQTTFRPPSDHGVALNVNAQLLGAQAATNPRT